MGFRPLFGTDDESRAEDADGSFKPMFGAKEPGAGGFRSLAEGVAATAGAVPEVTVEELVEAARAEGAAEARAEAEAELAQMRSRVEALEPAMDQLAELRSTAIRTAAEQIGTIVLQLTRRIVGDSLAVNPDALPTLVAHSRSQLPDDDEVVIRVAPDDVGAVRDALDDRFEDAVLGDPKITAGCRIETRHAAIDATLDAALEAAGAAVQTWVETRA